MLMVLEKNSWGYGERGLETSLALSFKLDVSWKACPINQKAFILCLIPIYKYLTAPWQQEAGLRVVYL